MSTSSAFSIRSRKVTERFLHSAVVVDDRASLGRDKREKVVPAVIPPSRGPRSPGRAESEQLPNDRDAALHDLDAKKLIDAFAELGIVCAILKPDLGLEGAATGDHTDTLESLSIRIDNATKRSDIVILDWNI